MKKGQTTDYIVISALIFIILIPLSSLLLSKVTLLKKTQLEDSINVLKNSVYTIYSLTPKSSIRVPIDIPKGINATLDGNKLIINHGDETIITKFPVSLVGNFPTNKGRHNINLYNNENNIIISECGNQIIEYPVEQCEQINNTNCNSGLNTCILSGSYRCQCQCKFNFECFTKLCDTNVKVCIYCNPPAYSCPNKYTCNNGICVKEEEDD